MFMEFPVEVKVNSKKHIFEQKGVVNTTAIFSSFNLILDIQNQRVASLLRQAPLPWKETSQDDAGLNLQKHSDFSEHETNGKLCIGGVIP